MKKDKELAGNIIKRDGKSNNINNLEKYNVVQTKEKGYTLQT